MNLLIISLCVLSEATVIIAKTKRLSETNSSAALLDVFNPLKLIDIRGVSADEYQYFVALNKSLYSYNYNNDTGIQTQEDGYLNNEGTDQETLKGNYSYTDNEGNTFRVSYVANENGFKPEGAHSTTISPLIQMILQDIAEHTEKNAEYKNANPEGSMSKIDKT